jgi:D-tyrosyl-tRNA(Tyr) deacylase
VKALIQRVKSAKVEIAGQIYSEIKEGILVFAGFDKLDEKHQVDKMIDRVLNYRVFNDDEDKMNLSVRDINGGVMIVPQFTLSADTSSGTRPGFSTAKPPSEAVILYDYLIKQINKSYHSIASGEFGADMSITLNNDGPVTFILSC